MSHFIKPKFLLIYICGCQVCKLSHNSTPHKGSHFSWPTFLSKISIYSKLLWFGLVWSTGPSLYSTNKRVTLFMSHFLEQNSCQNIVVKVQPVNISSRVMTESCAGLVWYGQLDHTCIPQTKGSHFLCHTFLSKIPIRTQL